MPTLTTLDVTGMTCGHCVSAVTSELNEVDGVERVSVELVNGGTSHVTIFSDDALAEDALRAAVDEAGYDVTAIEISGAEQTYAELADVRAEAFAGTSHAEGEPGDAVEAVSGGVGPVGITLSTSVPDGAASDTSGGGCGCGCGGH